ncbi:hypothetical protein [Halomonas llamarensis]|uniref:Lipoprotein n=1 Tax=Halomonas llamarensis TaxID=2945104 RepID=A0ABT0SRH9_9GAMM|nr:hypothetical protein [Halomonas llamarensis]MCL7930432.1 hypothetical protein [Halomonas llamarensis]
MKIITTLSAIALISGCAAVNTPLDSEYEFGQMTGSLLGLQAKYCANADPRRRAVIRAVLRSQGIGLPPSGACTSLIALMPQPTDAEIEAAKQDQQNAQGKSDAD